MLGPGVPPSVLEVLRHRATVRQRCGELEDAARDEILFYIRNAQQVAGDLIEERRALRRGVRMCALYESSLLDTDYADTIRRFVGAGLMTSVCTGSLVFATAGLLDGRPATTWWGALDMLADAGTNVDIQPNARFVDDGDIITAAGVSAGIDMALHLIARLRRKLPKPRAQVRFLSGAFSMDKR